VRAGEVGRALDETLELVRGVGLLFLAEHVT
jgi:hypothetical protein